MPEISLTLVVESKVKQHFNRHGKDSIKDEKNTSFGGINSSWTKLTLFWVTSYIIYLAYAASPSVICTARFSVPSSPLFMCGGNVMEDINLFLRSKLSDRPNTRVPCLDTVLRAIEELATENMSNTAKNSGKTYDFNTAETLLLSYN